MGDNFFDGAIDDEALGAGTGAVAEFFVQEKVTNRVEIIRSTNILLLCVRMENCPDSGVTKAFFT